MSRQISTPEKASLTTEKPRKPGLIKTLTAHKRLMEKLRTICEEQREDKRPNPCRATSSSSEITLFNDTWYSRQDWKNKGEHKQAIFLKGPEGGIRQCRLSGDEPLEYTREIDVRHSGRLEKSLDATGWSVILAVSTAFGADVGYAVNYFLHNGWVLGSAVKGFTSPDALIGAAAGLVVGMGLMALCKIREIYYNSPVTEIRPDVVKAIDRI